MEQSVFSMIADEIRQQIIDKKYKSGEYLPSENMLSSHYLVTRTTVRRALSLLMKENYISPIHGKGYVINEPVKNEFLLKFDEITGFTADNPVESQLLGVKIINPDVSLMLKLQIADKKRVVNIKRLFLSGGEPIGFDDKYVNYYTGIPIVEKEIHYMTFPNIFAKRTSLRELSEEIAISVSESDAYISSLLQTEPHESVMLIEQLIRDSEGTILGWAQTFYKADKFQIKAESF